jgi:spore maturation protein CgeB
MSDGLEIVVFGLSVTSSWGNGHATTYRALMRGLSARGHRVTFLERDLPWYADNRDLPRSPYGRVCMYSTVSSAKRRFRKIVAEADLVIVGSYVPEGIEIGEWVTHTAKGITAFYDIDTPITVAALERGNCNYLSPRLVSAYDLYLSFTGGAILRKIERRFGARRAEPLYCSVDPQVHSTELRRPKWDLGYIGTYSDDRQKWLDQLMLSPARQWKSARMVVAGAQYPEHLSWPSNVERVDHLPPDAHRHFYNSQRFTLNLTRERMRRAGYSPSVRLFEAAACGTPIISDTWPGLETFFRPGKEILISKSPRDTLQFLKELPEAERLAIGASARERILHSHTADRRAGQLESYIADLRGTPFSQSPAGEDTAVPGLTAIGATPQPGD